MNPRDVSEVLDLLADLKSKGEKVVVRTLGLHSPPVKGAREISLKKLSNFEIKGDSAVAEPGAPVKKVLEEALGMGYLIPTTYDGSIGGLVASEFPSPLSVKYGGVREWLKTVKLATYWGKVYSYRGFAGTFGKVGAIVGCELKLFAKPRHAFLLEKTYDSLNLTEYYAGIQKKPIAGLVEYDGRWKLYFSFEEDVELEGFNKDYGLVGFSYSPSNETFVTKVRSIEEFAELVERSKPALALFMPGSPYAILESPSNAQGLARFGSLDTKGLLLKRLFDPYGLFE